MNKAKLRGKMAEHNMTGSMLAEAIGLNRVTLYDKMNGHAEFKLAELYAIIKVLELSADDIFTIFFADEVA